MITYVDTSVLVKLVVEEPGSDRARAVWDASDVLFTGVISYVEGRAALAAGRRSGRLTMSPYRTAVGQIDELWRQFNVVDVDRTLVLQAAVLAEHEALRGYDAVHLATALAARCDVLASADADLCDAAARHGLLVADPLEGHS